jgi:alkylation response protein AidB-like acyl-CoA dehydrogenase
MNLSRSSDDMLLAESARRWLSSDAFAAAAPSWREFAEMGWLSLPVAESAGGAGAPDSSLAVFIEQLGYACCDSPFVPAMGLAAGLLGAIEGVASRTLLAAVVTGDELVVAADEPLLKASRPDAGSDGWVLSGEQPLVLGGDVASQFILPGYADDGALRLFAVRRDASGLGLTQVRCLGSCDAADLSLERVQASLLSEHDVPRLLEFMRDRCAAMACADAVGTMQFLVEATLTYTNSREQFKKPLSQFQVIEHYRAELLTALEEARAITQLAIAAIDADPSFRARAVSAAKVKVGRAARLIAQQSIQMHGAMGVTDELKVGLYAKRLLAFDVLCGSREEHLSRYAGLAKNDGVAATYLAQPQQPSTGVHLCLDPPNVEFRNEVLKFLKTALPAHLAVAQQLTTTVYPEADIASQWHRALYRQGWSASNWPQEHGGPGWTAEQRYVWAHESVAAGAPIISPIGLPLVGPVLMHFGSPAQRARYLPPIVSGEELWCQGFSEPGAGSDLAALSTRATREDGDYIVNGSKIWTTHGHFAHFMAALVRTSSSGGRRDGISFLLIDMRSPGITIRPIFTIGGDHELNQIFFDDVRVPATNLVGDEGQGWAIAKFMLEYERGGDIMSAGHRRLMCELREIALRRKLSDPHSFWLDFAQVAVDIDTLEMLELRALLGCTDSSPASASILKLRASEIQQAVTELGLRVLGRDSIRWESHRPLYELPDARAEQGLVSRYLNSRANTIFGGTREIQKTLIARAAAT